MLSVVLFCVCIVLMYLMSFLHCMFCFSVVLCPLVIVLLLFVSSIVSFIFSYILFCLYLSYYLIWCFASVLRFSYIVCLFFDLCRRIPSAMLLCRVSFVFLYAHSSFVFNDTAFASI